MMHKLISSAKFRTTAALIFLLAIVVFAFWPTLSNEFVLWDDDVHLFKNISVRTLDLEHVKDIFTEKVNGIYIPLTTLTFAVEYNFFGKDPFVYHLNNLLLHVGITVLVFWLGRRLGLSHAASFLAAVIFGIHPMHVESVAWITERKDVLYGFFYMAALVSYSYYLDFTRSTSTVQNQKHYRYLVLTTIFGIISMLAKPMALSLPLILLLLDWMSERKWDRSVILEKIPVGLAIAGITLITYVSHARIPGRGIDEAVMVWCWTLVFYLRQFLFPAVLVPIYELPRPVSIGDPQYLISLLCVAVLIVAVIRFRRHRWFIFSAAFFFFSIFFLLRYDVSKDANVVADRFMYLPSIGFCFLAGYGLQRLIELRNAKLTAGALLICAFILGFLTVRTIKQGNVWHDSRSLWNHQLKYYPNEPISLNNLVATLRETEEYQRAENIYVNARKVLTENRDFEFSPEVKAEVRKVQYLMGLYRKAILANPNGLETYIHLGNLLKDLNHVPESIKAYEEALKIDHENKDALFGLGELFENIGDSRKAVEMFDQIIAYNKSDEDVYVVVVEAYNEYLSKNPENAILQDARKRTMDRLQQLIRQNPQRTTSYFNLGYLYGGMKDYESAIAAYQMALDINPMHGNTLYNIGNLYRDMGQLSRALEYYDRAISANPRHSDAYMNKGGIFERQGKRDLAKDLFMKAVKVNPQNARALFNLGSMAEASGNLKKAVEYYQKSIEIDSSNKIAYYNLGNVYARIGNDSQAMSSYMEALKIDNEYVDVLVNLSILSYKMGDFDQAVEYYDEATLLGYIAPKEYSSVIEKYR